MGRLLVVIISMVHPIPGPYYSVLMHDDNDDDDDADADDDNDDDSDLVE